MVCPVIDVIDWNTFEYLGNSGEPQIGGFDWRLVFTWHSVPEYEQKRRRSPIDVIRCVMCAFLMDNSTGLSLVFMSSVSAIVKLQMNTVTV